MDKFEQEIAELKAKRAKGNFTWKDLSSYVQEKVAEGTAVFVLKKNKWVVVDNTFQVLMKEHVWDMDDTYVRIVTRPHRPYLNWFYLPIFRNKNKDEGEWVTSWGIIPNTNIIIDVWYVGDGSEGVVLAALTTDL